MNFKEFEECIGYLIEMYNKNAEVYSRGVDLIEYWEPYEKAFSLLWAEILTEEGEDWLYWYLYEKDGITGNPREDMKAWDSDKKEICQNLENLHDYLMKSNYFRRVNKS